MNHKIFISVDMEGITGVIHWDETIEKNPDYPYFREIMTKETNAAIEGALEAGATEITVRDAHNNARNIIPDMLHEKARLLREWAKTPYIMMDGIDDSYDAAICIGYHAKANSPNSVLKHTLSETIYDLEVNGNSVAELDWNGLIAAYHNVPVIFVSGDSILCKHAKERFESIETVVVKEGIGQAALNLHPRTAQALIKQGVKKSLQSLHKHQPIKFATPNIMKLTFKSEEHAHKASWYPKAQRINETCISFTSNDFFDCMRFLFYAI